MSAIFKFLFERATDPLGLPINALYEYIILAVIDAIAYGIAYSKVGDMYHGGLISGRTEGSFFHWLCGAVASCLLCYSGILLCDRKLADHSYDCRRCGRSRYALHSGGDSYEIFQEA